MCGFSVVFFSVFGIDFSVSSSTILLCVLCDQSCVLAKMSESNKDTSEGYDFSDLSIDDTINIDDNAAINPIPNCVLINWKSIHESKGKNKTFSIDMNKFPFQQVYVLNSSKKLLLDISKWQNYEDIGDDYNRKRKKKRAI